MAKVNIPGINEDKKIREWEKALLKVNEKNLKEMETALCHDVEYPSVRQRLEEALARIKEKRGLFFKCYRNYLEHRLRKAVDKGPKKLDEEGRMWLRAKIEHEKSQIASLKESLRENG